MNFKEPVSTFTYNLISLHHDVMWYVILILSLVYWTLYKIIKEYLWSISQKQDGFFYYFIKIMHYIKYNLFYYLFDLNFFF